MEPHRWTSLSALSAGPRPAGSPSVPCLRAFGLSDTGQARTHNEDRFYCDPARGLFVVIDGVGGEAAGDVAADLALDLVRLRLRFRSGTVEERLHKAILTANRAIFAEGEAHPEQRGMACVLTAAVVQDDCVTVGHVGDARLYEIRPDGLCKITRDHSVVGVQEDAGVLSEWEAMRHPRRHEILRDVGSAWHEPGEAGFIDVYRFPFRPASALLLCTDGLTDLVPSEVLFETVRAHAGDPEAGARALVHLANQAGGTDNVTVVLVEGAAFAGAVRQVPGGPAVMPADAPAEPSGWGRRLGWIGLALAVLALAVLAALAWGWPG